MLINYWLMLLWLIVLVALTQTPRRNFGMAFGSYKSLTKWSFLLGDLATKPCQPRIICFSAILQNYFWGPIACYLGLSRVREGVEWPCLVQPSNLLSIDWIFNLLSRFLSVFYDNRVELFICMAWGLWNHRNALRLGLPSQLLDKVGPNAAKFL